MSARTTQAYVCAALREPAWTHMSISTHDIAMLHVALPPDAQCIPPRIELQASLLYIGNTQADIAQEALITALMRRKQYAHHTGSCGHLGPLQKSCPSPHPAACSTDHSYYSTMGMSATSLEVNSSGLCNCESSGRSSHLYGSRSCSLGKTSIDMSKPPACPPFPSGGRSAALSSPAQFPLL